VSVLTRKNQWNKDHLGPSGGWEGGEPLDAVGAGRMSSAPAPAPGDPAGAAEAGAPGADSALGIVILRDIRPLEPLGYLEFLDLMEHAGVFLTDSGGIQEETTFLGVPCLALRRNTERILLSPRQEATSFPFLDPPSSCFHKVRGGSI
jgi:hypothetical protein